MTLVDTSVWVDHFRNGNAGLTKLLDAGEVLIHPMVLGELACGMLPNRNSTLTLLGSLPQTPKIDDEHVLFALDANHWWRAGIGWVDAHLLTAALSSNVPLITLDKRLAKLAMRVP